MEDRQIGRIASWVMEHVDEKVTLENVAAGVYMNPTYVSHIFKKGVRYQSGRLHCECKNRPGESAAAKSGFQSGGCCSCSRLFQCRVFFQNIQKENRCHTSCLAERQEQPAEKLTLHFEDAIIFLNSKKDACGNEEKRAE